MNWPSDMTSIHERATFQCGLYAVTFATPELAAAFVERYRACPNWPVVAIGPEADQVYIVAIELRCQQHGDFSQACNTLVAHPEHLGAQVVYFQRYDNLLTLFPGHKLTLGTAEQPPCGSDCTTCPIFQAPCQGCPATWRQLPG
jgi:hypothetical protein